MRRFVEVTCGERASQQRGEIVTKVPGEWLLPYVHQRYDDLAPVGTDAGHDRALGADIGAAAHH